jgi:hypothetical protein
MIVSCGSPLPLAQCSSRPSHAAVRDKDFLYVEHATGEKELYDLRAGNANYDPHQLRPSFQQAAMQAFARNWRV